MNGVTRFLANQILNSTFKGTGFAYTPVRVSLHSADPGEAGSFEIPGVTFVPEFPAERAAVPAASWNVASGGSITNNATVVCANMAGPATATHMAFQTKKGYNDTASKVLFIIELSSPIVITGPVDTTTFAPGNITVSFSALTGTDITPAFANMLLDMIFRAVQPAFVLKVSLHDGDPGDDGANEISGNAYARLPLNGQRWNAANNGTIQNASRIIWPDLPAVTLTHIGFFSGSTFLMSKTLAAEIPNHYSLLIRSGGIFTVTLGAPAATDLAWRLVTSSITSNGTGVPQHMVYSPDLEVIISTGITTSGTQPSIGISFDGGETWRTATKHDMLGLNGGCWLPDYGRFVVVAQAQNVANPFRVWVSTDGDNWTGKNASSARGWIDVAYAPELGRLCAIASGTSGVKIMTSDDGGESWADQTAPAGSHAWRSICWTGSRFVVCHAQGSTNGTNAIMTSSTGLAGSWTLRTTPSGGNIWFQVQYAPALDLVVAVGGDGSDTSNRTMHSTDHGTTWALGDIPAFGAFDGEMRGVAWSEERGQFGIVGFADSSPGSSDFPTGELAQCNDGIVVVENARPTTNRWICVIWAGAFGRFVGGGDIGDPTPNWLYIIGE